MGLVVLDGFEVTALDDPSFVPSLGYFVSNDVTARIFLAMAPEFRSDGCVSRCGKEPAGLPPGGPDAVGARGGGTRFLGLR